MTEELAKKETQPAPGIPPAEEQVVVGKVQPFQVENPRILARKIPIPISCAQCGAKTKRSSTARPFQDGPFKGGFLCGECWILFWDDHPEVLADAKSRQWAAREARAIRVKRAGAGSELIFDEDGNRAYLTPRGTILIDLKRLPFGGPDEYNPERFKILSRMFEAAGRKGILGYGPDEPPPASPPPSPAA